MHILIKFVVITINIYYIAIFYPMYPPYAPFRRVGPILLAAFFAASNGSSFGRYTSGLEYGVGYAVGGPVYGAGVGIYPSFGIGA